MRRRWLVAQHSPAGTLPVSWHWTRAGARSRAALLNSSVPNRLFPSLYYRVHRRTSITL
jgi:hypothetical protein